MSFYKSSTTKKGAASGKTIISFGKELLAISVLVLGFAAQAKAVCFVSEGAKGTNDGSSWTNAYTDLQSGLRDTSCSEIWVARGVYKPTPGTDRTISFVVPSNMTVYGGFIGDETNRDQRVPAVNTTVLSGDVDNNDANVGTTQIDVTTANISGGNSFHVVYIDGTTTPVTSSTVLDGFTITGGDANDTANAYFQLGGGLYCNGMGSISALCSPTLRNLVFSGNYARQFGGGMFNVGSQGGTSSPALIDVTFSFNAAGNEGGAIYDKGSIGTSSPTLTNVFFDGNTATTGGAIFNLGDGTLSGIVGTSSPTLSSVVFANNFAETGGAMYNMAEDGGLSSPTLSVVTFNGNKADSGPTGGTSGGAVYNWSEVTGSICAPTFVNVTFNGNSAGDYGGAMYNSGLAGGNTNAKLVNVTFDGNSAGTSGGAIYSVGASGPTSTTISMSNVILWSDIDTAGNEAHEIGNAGAVAGLDHSVLQDGCPTDGTFICTNVLTGDPKLSPLSENGGFTRTMVPGFGSSAIDTGLDAACPNIDQRSLSRPQGPHCEIGAVEVVPSSPPVAQPLNITIPENTAGNITFAATDSNPGGPFSFTYTILTRPNHGTPSAISGGAVTFTPDSNYTGPDSFTYSATDTNGTSAPATVTIQVIATPPVADPKSFSVPHNTAGDVTLTASDSNAGGPFSYTFSVVTPTTHGTVSLAGDVATYKPVTDYTGPDSFTYTATDVNGISLLALVTIQVAPAPPIAVPRVIVVPYNTSKSVTFGATDSNLGGPFSYTFAVASAPTHGTLGLVEGNTILYTPTHGYSGPDAFTYTVTDVNGVSVSAPVTITVLPPGGGGGTTGSTTAIPTLSTWSLLTLAGLLGLTCVWRKRNT